MSISKAGAHLVAAVSFLLLTGGAQAEIAISPEEYLRGKDVCSLRCEQMRASVVMHDEFAASRMAKQGEQVAARYRTLVARYKKQRDDFDTPGALLKANNHMVRLLASWVPVAGYAMDQLLDSTEEVYERGRLEAERQTARWTLKQIEEQFGAERSRELAEASPAQRQALLSTLLSESADELLGPAFADISDQAVRDEFQNAIIRQLAENLEEVAHTALVQDERIARVAADLAELQKGSEQTAALRARYAEDPPSDERLKTAAALSEGTPAQQIERLEKIKEMQVREFAADAEKVAGQAAAAADIFARLGERELAKGAGFLAGAAGVAAGIALSQVNPLAILPTISQGLALFNVGGGGDPKAATAEMFKQIIEAIKEIGKIIETNHNEVMARLDEIDGHVLIGLAQLAELLEGDLFTCTSLVPNDRLDETKIPNLALPLHFVSYAELAAHVESSAKSAIGQCLGALNKDFANRAIGPNEPPSQRFRIVPAAASGRGSPEQIDAHVGLHTDTSAFAESLLTKPALYALAALANSRPALQEKFDSFMGGEPPQPDLFFEKYLPVALNARSLEVASALLIAVHPYYEFTRGGELMMVEELFAPEGGAANREGFNLLSTALAYVDVALAQQALAAGDVLLPILYAAVTERWDLVDGTLLPRSMVLDGALAPDKQAQVHETALSLLRRNRLLAHNLLIYAMGLELSEKASNAIAYHVALSSRGDPALLRRVMVSPWQLHWSQDQRPQEGIPAGWYVRIGEANVALPTAQEVAAQDFYSTPAAIALSRVKDRILTEMAGYRPVLDSNAVSSGDHIALKEALMLGMPPL